MLKYSSQTVNSFNNPNIEQRLSYFSTNFIYFRFVYSCKAVVYCVLVLQLVWYEGFSRMKPVGSYSNHVVSFSQNLSRVCLVFLQKYIQGKFSYLHI